MAKYRKYETAEQSSDEEELFSYLKKVHKFNQLEHEVNQAEANEVKQAELHGVQVAEGEVKQENSIANTEKSCAYKPDGKYLVKETGDDTSDVVLNISNKTEDEVQNTETNKIDIELHIATQSDENKEGNNTDESNSVELANTESSFEQNIEINSCTESKALVNKLDSPLERSNIEVVVEQNTEFISENKDASPLKDDDTDKINGTSSKQNHESSGESDKYYLINEKDWLSLCAKLANTDKQVTHEEQQDASKTDSLDADSSNKQDIDKETLVETETKSPSLKGKSMFTAFKQYNPVTKATLKRADLDQKPLKASPRKVCITSETKKMDTSNKGQTMSVFGNELKNSNNDSKILGSASPKVEIVYIRLEDGQIKYDASKSPLASTEEANLQAVKKLDFSEHNKGLAFEKRIQDQGSIASAGLQNSSQDTDNGRNSNSANNPKNAIEGNQESSYPNTDFKKADDTHYDTDFKPGMQVRFVRINNKLTRVYENVERNIVDEVLNASLDDEHNRSEPQEYSALENDDDDNEDDSFNFDDSQLVAFPLNAIDPDMVIKDDSLTQLTPSKLEFLNSGKLDPETPSKFELCTPNKSNPLTPNKLKMFTPSKLDPLTPSKLEMFTPSKLDQLTPSKLEMFTPSKLDMLTPSKLEILSTGELDLFGDDTDIKKFDDSPSSPNHNTAKQVLTTDVLNEDCETESPIVLTVTKSGQLVQCKSNESSPERNTHRQQLDMSASENCQQNQKSHIQNLWKSFRPVQRKNKVIRKQHLSVKENKEADYQHIENYDDRDERSSDEDDLTNYFSMTKPTSKKSVSKKSDVPSFSVSIQASFPDTSDDSNDNEETQKLVNKKVRKRKFSKVEGGKKKINNKTLKTPKYVTEVEVEAKPVCKVEVVENKTETVLKTAKSTSDNIKVQFEELPSSKIKLKRNKNETGGNIKKKAIKSASIDKTMKSRPVDSDNKTSLSDSYISDSLSGSKGQTCKKKGNTQILRFYKDCNYKQVDFKDFELEDDQMSKAPNMDKGKEKVGFYSDEQTAVKEHPVTEKLKEREKVQSTSKVNAVKIRKRKVNSDTEVKERIKVQSTDEVKEVKDFELEDAQMSKAPNMNKGNGKVCFHNEGKTAVEEHPVIETVKEIEKVQSTGKVSEVRIIKSKANSDKEVKQTNANLKVQMKSKGKKSCLKKGLEQNECKTIENSVKIIETGIKPECKADDKMKTSLNDQSQKKIEFLEKLFQIKLKEAVTDTTDKKCSTPESPSVQSLHEENTKSIIGRKPKTKMKSSVASSLLSIEKNLVELPVAEESFKTGKHRKVRNKIRPAAIKSKGRKDETSDKAMPRVNNKQVMNTLDSNKSASGSRKYKSSKKVVKGKYRQDQNIPEINDNLEKDTIDVRQTVSDERIQIFDDAKPPDVNKPRVRQRKQHVTLGINNKSSESKAEIMQTICYKTDKTKQVAVKGTSKSRGKITKRKSKVSTNVDGIKTKNLDRQTDALSLSANATCEVEFTKIKKPRCRSKVTKISKTEKCVETKILTCSVNDMQRVVENKNIEIGPDTVGKGNKKGPSGRTTRNIIKNQSSGKRIRNTKRKYSSSKNVSSGGKSDPNPNNELQSSKIKGNVQLGGGNLDDQLDTNIVPSQRLGLLNHERLSPNSEDLNSQDGIVSILATFQPLQEEDSSKNAENKTKGIKRNKIESDYQDVTKSKKLKLKTEVEDISWEYSTNESELTHKGESKQSKQGSISYFDEDKNEMPLDLSLPRKGAQKVNESSFSKDKNIKTLSPKKLRDGKVLKKNSSKGAAGPKKLKSARKPSSSGKLKTATKKQDKESWKDRLDDEAFKLDFDEKVKEDHKPVNVRHMIRNILKSVKGAEKKSDRHVKQRERKDTICKHGKSIDGNAKQRLTSESDDAWLSDSGPSASFPAFKFTGIGDSEEIRPSSQSEMIDSVLENSVRANNKDLELNRIGNDEVTEMSDSQLFKQADTETENSYMELHHSPRKVSSSHGTNSASSDNSVNLTSVETKHLVGNSKGSPEMKKNVDKLRALLDKVSDKRVHVVKHLQFADPVSLSDTEH